MNYDYCPYCGYRFNTTANPSICPNCGEILNPEDEKFYLVENIIPRHKKIEEIIKKYTRPSAMDVIHRGISSKPVPSCFNSVEDYDNCVNEICKLLEDR
jgi:hypothetical protein